MNFFSVKKFNKVCECLEQKNWHKAIEQMEKWQPANLAYFQEKHPEFISVIRKEAFKPFWEKQQQKLAIPKKNNFRFVQSEWLIDADFVTGYLFYLLALKNLHDKDSEQYLHYLQKAIEFHSIHALQRWMHEFIIQDTDKKSDYFAILLQNLAVLEPLASKHLTPGYLLLAKGYLHAALTAGSVKEPERRNLAINQVWKFLHLAQLLESYSKAAIHNAYFGEGIINSNVFALKSIYEMKATCLKIAGKNLNLSQQGILEEQARAEFRKKHQPYLEKEESSIVAGKHYS